MKLQSKLALFNALSKALIILVFVTIMPLLIKQVALVNTDDQLREKKEQVLSIIEDSGISFFLEGAEDGYGSYNLLKEEFISLEKISPGQWTEEIEDSQRMVEDEIVNYRVLSHTFSQGQDQYLLEVGRSLSTIHEIESTLRKFAFYLLLIIIILTVLSDIAFTKYLLRPLNLIIRKLRNTQDPASFHFDKISTNTTDFQYLDESIHDMMARIEAVFLKEREFISNVSHELLTPVSILQSKLENMLSSESLTEENEVRMIEAQQTLARLKNIIRALLLISKIENEQYLRKDSITFVFLIDEVIEEIEERLLAKEIILRKEFEEDFQMKACNKALLFNMVFNLINNAIKYNHTRGEIIIKGYKSITGYVLEINDKGIGMQPESIPHIFNRFKRLHKPDQESFGLGLPIVKTIADFHKIVIKVKALPGKGSSFHLHIPSASPVGMVPVEHA